jgi:hypothetical protein
MEDKTVVVHTRPLFAAGLLLASAPALATTKGLSQIVTPDLQPEGELSLSAQAQAKHIGIPFQAQAEIGLTSWLEVAAFQGFDPSEQIFGAELQLVKKDPWLLSTGFINWGTKGDTTPQPFLEGGYYGEHSKPIAGAIIVDHHLQALLGYAYDFNDVWRAQVDYQSGSDNFFTFGITCTPSQSFQFNPAVYFSNTGNHRAYGYIVMTYTLPVWHPHEAK